MRLKPSFGWKLNEQGFSPIHLALQNNQHNLVRRLVEINKDLVRVKGREGVTPLHFLCQSGDDNKNIKLLIDLLEACPDSIEDVNVRNETALHIALINQNLSAFRKLVHWLVKNVRKGADSLEVSILNWKNSEGNTILHIAIINDNEQAFDLLIGSIKVDINARNLENQTALDLAEARPLPTMNRKLQDRFALFINRFRRGSIVLVMDRIKAEVSEEQRNANLVIATLMLTVIYQTVLSPPGGLTQGSDNDPSGKNLLNSTSSHNSTAAGKSVMPQKTFYLVTVLNAYVFLFAIGIIISMLPKSFSAFAVFSILYFMTSYFVSEAVIWP
ncbi:ankyrin repeat-containing protein BDA1-like isoform X2 [Arachis ipaensis]|nr:ankyrin repeat-containing protein BDA1-like isoform X2 [Arachis ipaensis]